MLSQIVEYSFLLFLTYTVAEIFKLLVDNKNNQQRYQMNEEKKNIFINKIKNDTSLMNKINLIKKRNKN